MLPGDNLPTQECRGCGERNLKELGFVGEVAPFFLKRVLNMEIGTAQARHPLRLIARRMAVLPQRLFSKIYGQSAYVEMQLCLNCSMIQTKYPFSQEALGRLYADYRSRTYNQERIKYEPTYAAIAKDVGSCKEEVQVRAGGLTLWLADKLSLEKGDSMLDFGGSDGRFLPNFPAAKTVFEISDAAPLEGIAKIANEAELGTYSYVQMAHVLEHVPHPLTLVKQIASYVKQCGYLYIEVPQDVADPELAEWRSGRARQGLTVHEHINMFSVRSINCLVHAAGLEVISVEAARADLGWTTCTNIRALCRKNKSVDNLCVA